VLEEEEVDELLEELPVDESFDAAGFDSDLELSEEFACEGGLPFPFP